MKNLGHYSLEKFSSFPPKAKLKALDKLISALEQALGNEQERLRLIGNILELSSLLEKPLSERLELFLMELHPRLSPHQLLNKLYFYHGGALRTDSQLTLRRDQAVPEIPAAIRQTARKVSIICDNLRSVFNVGSLFRIAECLGLGELILCGITPDPEHPNMTKTAMGTHKMVQWTHFDTTPEAILSCRKKGYSVTALETTPSAVSVFDFQVLSPLALVIGNESLGISPEAMKLCDNAIFIPQLGWKSSLNVGVASAVCLYQLIMGGDRG